jgi:hypothetical protein
LEESQGTSAKIRFLYSSCAHVTRSISFRFSYGTVEIVIGIIAIFGLMRRAPVVVVDPAARMLLMVQPATGMYIIIRGFDNFGQVVPFSAGFVAFRVAWDLIRAGPAKQGAGLRAEGDDIRAGGVAMPRSVEAGQMLEKSETGRSRLHRFQERLGIGKHTHGLMLVLWPLIALVIAVLALRLVTTAKELADLISAFAALMWPVAVLTIVGWFRPEFRAVLSRIRKGKFLGQEIELDELQAKTEEAEATEPVAVVISGAASTSAAGSVSAEGGHIEAAGNAGIAIAEAEIEEVLREASRSPRIGLMLLSAKMERAARDLAADFGVGVSRNNLSLSMLIRQLVEADQLTRQDAAALGLFNQVRNRIVHGHDAEDDEIARAIDSGTRLLRILLARQRLR